MAKDYSQMNKEDLIKEIDDLRSRKSYGLVWDDKSEDVVRYCETKIPVLDEDEKRLIEKEINKPTNFIIEGDNYHALSVLNYTHRGRVDAIYIDPPYNTGARDWRYNNDYVDGEDPYKHTKWISFMNHRLKLAKNLLKDDGIICVTIDDYELPRLWLLLEEIFGRENHLGTVAIRINPGGRKSKRKIALQHEYALFFSKKNSTKVSTFYVDPEDKSHNFYQGDDGRWYEDRNLRKEGQDSLAKKKNGKISDRYYPIYLDPESGEISVSKKLKKEILPIDTKGQKRIWRRGKEDIEEMFANGDLFARETRNGYQIYFRFASELKGETPKSFWGDKKYSASEHGTSTLDQVMGVSGSFQFPKSPHAVIDCIRVCTDKKDALILDFFAGSGTTGQAVLELNKKDKGNRRFILCTNNENKIAEGVTYPRVKNVIDGYGDVEGIPANLRYYKTAFVDVESVHNVSDQKKIELTYQAGRMIALREDTLEETEKNDWWQIFTDKKGKTTAIYFKEDKEKLNELIEKINSSGSAALYIFSWGKNEYKNEYTEYKNIRVEDIPEPILEVYKEINKK